MTSSVSSVSPETPAESFLRKRAFKACLHCRSRKAKCQFEGVDFNPPCLRCRREGKDCRFVPSRRGGRNRVKSDVGVSGSSSNKNGDDVKIEGGYQASPSQAGGPNQPHQGQGQQVPGQGQTHVQNHNSNIAPLSTSLPQSMATQLPTSLPNVSPMHQSSNPNAGDYQTHTQTQNHQHLSQTLPQSHNQPHSQNHQQSHTQPMSHNVVDAESIAVYDLRNPSDAVEMMSLANLGQFNQIQDQSQSPHSRRSFPNSRTQRNFNPQLSDVNLVRAGILSPTELKNYVSLFFNRHHHYMPIVPEARIPTNDQQLAVFSVEEPLLLAAMVVIATRHESLSVHRACWKFLQLEISNLVWGSKPNVGSIEALLLISDNLPLITDADINIEDDIREIHKYEERLSWNLVGLAIRNSYYLGFDQKTLISATEVTDEETHRIRLVWTYCYIFDRQASVRAGKAFWSRGPGICFQNQSGFGLPVGQTSMTNFPTLVSSSLDDDNSTYVQALLEVTQILTNVHDTLYPNRDRTIALAEVGDYCRLLDEFIRTFSEFEITWESRQWRVSPINELVWMSFHFSALYAYSFGFQAHVRRAIAMVRLARRMNPNNSSNLPIIATIFPRGVTGTADSKYILESIKAATKIVSITVNELFPSGTFTYLPYRFYGYISYAAVFLIKAVFTGAIASSSQPSILGLLDRLIRNLETVSTESNSSRQNYRHPCGQVSEQLKLLMNSLLTFNKEHKHSPDVNQGYGQTTDNANNEFQFELNDDDLDELNALLTIEVNENWLKDQL